MPTSEFIILIGVIMAGLIFLLASQNFISSELTKTKEQMYKAEAEEIVSLIQRTTSEQGNYFYYFQNISLSNISVKNGMLSYQKDNLKFLYSIPKEVNESVLIQTASVCILKRNGYIKLLDKCPKCNMDSVCGLDECKENCEDCYGPVSTCVGDGFCNRGIGESCENSVDCPCKAGICCSSSPDSDSHGCSNITKIELGKECWCSSQCKSGLDCNPTAPSFTQYRKACCTPDKGWNGTACVNIKCPDSLKCSGAPMTGGVGDHAWIDISGEACCPSSNIGDISGPICSMKHCCPTHKPKWCSKPMDGQPRCMSEQEYRDKTKCKPTQVFVVTFISGFYSDLNSFNARATLMKDFTEKTLPFRENPETLVILIGKENCPMSSEDDISALKKCGNDLAQVNGYPGSQLTGGILGICVGGDGCGGTAGYTDPGQGWFVAGYDACERIGCPSIDASVVAPHEIGHNFRLCEGYSYAGYAGERSMFGGYCGTSKIEQKFPYQRSATSDAPCGNCGGGVCCRGRILDGDTINPASGGRDAMGPVQKNPDRAFACDSYLAFRDVAISVYNFDLPAVTDLDVQSCYNHIQGDTYP